MGRAPPARLPPRPVWAGFVSSPQVSRRLRSAEQLGRAPDCPSRRHGAGPARLPEHCLMRGLWRLAGAQGRGDVGACAGARAAVLGTLALPTSLA